MRIVLEPGLLVSYALNGGSIMQRMMTAWRSGEFALLSTPSMRAELKGVLKDPEIRRLSAVPLDILADSLDKYSIYVKDAPHLEGLHLSAAEERYLACAVEGKAQYAVTRRRDLLALGVYREVCILSPNQFLIALHLAKLAFEAIRAQYSLDTLKTILSDLHLESCTRDKLIDAIDVLSVLEN